MNYEKPFFKGIVDVIRLLEALSKGQKTVTRHKRRVDIKTVCNEAIEAVLIYLLDWCLERSQRGEDELSALRASGMEQEVMDMVLSLESIACGQSEDVEHICKAASETITKLFVMHNYEKERLRVEAEFGGNQARKIPG